MCDVDIIHSATRFEAVASKTTSDETFIFNKKNGQIQYVKAQRFLKTFVNSRFFLKPHDKPY